MRIGPDRPQLVGEGIEMALRLHRRRADKRHMSSSRASRRLRDARRNERGQAVVEFALILPVFIILVAGIIKFGIALNFWLDEQRLANQAARWAAVNRYPMDPLGSGTCSSSSTLPCTYSLQQVIGAQRLAKGENTTPYICFPVKSGIVNGNPAPAVGDPVTVRITRHYNLGIPFLPLGVDIDGSATMRLEQAPTVFSEDGAC
jgi:hypothetical protein